MGHRTAKGEYDAEDEQVDGVPTAACGGGFRGIAAQEGEEEEGRAMRRSFFEGGASSRLRGHLSGIS